MITDTNVTLSRWPFRRVRGDEPADLVSMLKRQGVTQAWAGSFDGLLHKDIGGVNSRLAAECEKYGKGFLVPFGTVNPKLPDWKEDLRRCHEVYRMPGIRLHPNYHRYELRDPDFAELIEGAAARSLIVEIAYCMEDERTQHPHMRVPPVNLAPLPALLRRVPNLRVVILNDRDAMTSEDTRRIADAGNVCFDIAMLEGPGVVARLGDKVSLNRVVFGSNFPLYYFESALLKVREAGFGNAGEAAVKSGNAARLWRQR